MNHSPTCPLPCLLAVFRLWSSAVPSQLSHLIEAKEDAFDLQVEAARFDKFFYKNGTQFFMKGIAYQADVSTQGATNGEAYHDPLADVEACTRDIPYLQELGTNIIRVYAVDPSNNHDQCMRLLDDAGIYVISDLSEPETSINRDDAKWDDVLYKRYTDVIDALQGYSNVMGFFAGNEVTNMPNNTDASAFVKAAVRDMKAYIKEKGYRQIPVGYATNDDEKIREQLADYFNCGDADERADFWGYNIYSWCGNSSYKEAGYDQRTKEFADYSIPVFFAEYGCNVPSPREFTDVPALYGDEMSQVFSGGIVYMYHQEQNNFGLVEVTSDGEVKKLRDFDNLKKQILNVNPKGVQMDDYNPTNTIPRDCPQLSENWEASNTLPPTPDEGLCKCMVESLECVASKNVEDKSMGELFAFVCGSGNVDCSGIDANSTSAQYGPFSMCSSAERLSWVFNEYYNTNGKTSQSCDFNGNATPQIAQSADKCQEARERASSTSTPLSTAGADDDSAAIIFSSLGGSFWIVGTVALTAYIAGAATVLM
ncbi:glycoside hydrolase family 72 protein [Kalaharituber pfeilii]|nr:glycoside hydrolase family 72 protein [Kalaharituber pfeilii]